MTTEEYESPDGLLKLVIRREDGDVTVGFHGFEWHTHGDLLAGSYARDEGAADLSPDLAAARFVADVVANRSVIVVQRIQGTIRGVWVTSDMEGELRYKTREEDLEFRYWDGRQVVAPGT
jgi:hypothetical protein